MASQIRYGEGAQVAVPYSAPVAIRPDTGLHYSSSTARGENKEAHTSDDSSEDRNRKDAPQDEIRRKLVCGLKRRTATLLRVAAFLIIVGVILATTLSTQLHSQNGRIM